MTALYKTWNVIALIAEVAADALVELSEIYDAPETKATFWFVFFCCVFFILGCAAFGWWLS